MKFEVIGHACLLVENEGKRLLVDPWLVGSAYWRSWWHFPESVPLNEEILSADYIFLTHEHFDHFHYPSLRRFRRDVTVIVPRFPVRSIEAAVAGLGFTNVVAIPHGRVARFPGGFELTSYQTTWYDDSVLFIRAGGHTLLDMNDARLEDLAFKRVARRHAPVDFLFHSHSPAQAYPGCYESVAPEDLALIRKDYYLDNFLNASKGMEARFSIPFASNVCFLHDESIARNEEAIDPRTLVEHCGRDPQHQGEVVVMLPGASWSSETGFELVSTDVLSRRDEVVAQLREKYAAKLAKQAEVEAALELSYETFSEYMLGFAKSLPWALRWVFRARIAFYAEVAGSDEWWVVDFGRRRVERTTRFPTEAASVITIAPGLLQDALEKNIVGFIDISKRLQIQLKPGCILQHGAFKELLTLYEMGYFPLQQHINWRFARVWFARRRELLSYVTKVVRGGEAFIPKHEAED